MESRLLEGNMLKNRRLELCGLLERKLTQRKEEGHEELPCTARNLNRIVPWGSMKMPCVWLTPP